MRSKVTLQCLPAFPAHTEMYASLHWYLAIICNPEHVLKPPPPLPTKVASSIQTRKRKRESEVPPEFDDSPTPGEPPQSDTREATPSRPRSGSEVDETSVEALIDGCNSSSQEQTERQTAPTPALIPDDYIGDLAYPSSEPDQMEVDAPPDETKVVPETPDACEAIEIEDSSQQVEDNEVAVVNDTSMEVDMNSSAATTTSTIPAAQFYNSTDKGKTRAWAPRHLSPEVPHPDTIMQSTEAPEHAALETSEFDTDPNKYHNSPRMLRALLSFLLQDMDLYLRLSRIQTSSCDSQFEELPTARSAG